MKIAVVTLGIGPYWKGCKTVLHSLGKFGKLPDTVDRIMLCNPEEANRPGCNFATVVPITDDYSDIVFPVKMEANRERFFNSFKRVFAFTLPYDRIVYVDSDMCCVGDTTLLWDDRIGKLPFYACRDTACYQYYPTELAACAIDYQLVFNGGLEVFHPNLLPQFYHDMLSRLRANTLSLYDGADQGLLNSYFQFNKLEVGLLPQGLNYVLDPYMPVVPEWERRIIHFTSSHANPWTSGDRNSRDPTIRKYYQHWQECWQECLGDIR